MSQLSRMFRFMFLTVVVVSAVTVAALAVTARLGNAQQLPKPTHPHDECCELMAPGGHTIAGPAIRTMATAGEEFVFQSTVPVELCVTFTNLNTVGSTTVHPVLDGISTALVGGPGETQTVCSRTRSVKLVCESAGGACLFRWRIDSVND